MNITILTNKKSWMNQYNIELKDELKKQGHIVEIIHSKNEMKKGDIAFFLSCFEIIESDFLTLNNHNIVVHASNLPRGKGWSPASWQILEGKNDIPLTLFEASDTVDAGNWYIKDVLKLNGAELIYEWQEKLGRKIIEMCMKYVEGYDELKSIIQKGEETFYSKRTPKDSKLDIDKTIREQFNLLRIVDNANYPAFFELNGHKYILKICEE